MRSRWDEASSSSPIADGAGEAAGQSRERRLPFFARTWPGAVGCVLVSLGADLLMVWSALDKQSDACTAQSMGGLIVSSLVLMVLAALPAVESLAWLGGVAGRRGRAALALAIVVAGLMLTVVALVAIWNTSPGSMICD